MIKRTGFKRRLEYWGLKALLHWIQGMPLKSALNLADDLGWFAFNILKIRRKMILSQLTRVFGEEKTSKEIKEIALRVYQNFGKTLFEFGRIPITAKDELLERVQFENFQIFEEALAQGKGAVIVTGHFGSWEMLGAATAAKDFPVSFLVGRQHNTYVDDLMNKIRSDAGISLIPLKLALRGVLKALRGNQIVAMLSDQDAGKSSVFVDFLGVPASTPAGPALFSLKIGAPIIPVFIIRQPDGVSHKAIIEPPINIESTGDKEMDIQNLTQAYTSVLEKYVREYPDHWFWLHRRWKRKPPKK